MEEAGKDELWNVLPETTDVTTERNLTCTPYVIWEGVPHGEKEDGVRYLLIQWLKRHCSTPIISVANFSKDEADNAKKKTLHGN